MAKAKKKELTPEERLQEALVPVEEQPYQIPDNWKWLRGNGILLPMESKKPSGKEFYYIDIDAIDNTKQCVSEPKLTPTDKAPSRESRGVREGDTVFSLVRPYLKNIAYIDASLNDCIASTGFFVCRPEQFINSRFLYWLMVSSYVVDGLNQYMKGDNSPSIRANDIENFAFPVPPLAEQQRIVNRIESLFAKLDEAREKAQQALESFEIRKAAMLYQAFNGELTAQWRENHGVAFDSWETRTIQDVCSTKITDGTHKTPTYCDPDIGIPFISAKDVTTGKICWDNIKYIVPELHEELYRRLAPQVDDVLLAKNGTTGVAAIVEEEKVFDLYVTLAVLRPDKTVISPRYLLNIVNSPVCKDQFDEHLTGIGVPNLHLRDIKEVTIKVPSMEEQNEVVRLIDLLMDKEQKAKEVAEEVIDQIELMKKSILAKAFRGELGTNDPYDDGII